MLQIDVKKGLINTGNWADLKDCMQKAIAGKPVKTGFLGGSITQGCLSSVPETCYSYLVYLWWKERFPQAEVTYINAGVGGTSSQYGVARVEKHLLQYEPDFLLAEFAVNDENTEFFKETYEGLVRKILKAKKRPALMLMNNVRYDNGENAEDMHIQVAAHYDVPMVSMKTTIWPEVEKGAFTSADVTKDDLHPNDAGHRLVADVIIDLLEQIYASVTEGEGSIENRPEVLSLPAPMTANQYETSVLYQASNSEPILNGFVADHRQQENVMDLFKNGFTADKIGDKFSIEVFGTGIAIQYRKSIHKPTPIARIWVDGQTDDTMILDGNFEEDWGDCLYIQTISRNLEKKMHQVEIEIIEASKEDAVPFYLVAVIGSAE